MPSHWGHGGYLAPDWSADWLHREAVQLLAITSARSPFPGIAADKQQRMHQVAVQDEMRRNSFDVATQTITVSTDRAAAIKTVEAHYTRLYEGSDDEALALRRDYAFPLAVVGFEAYHRVQVEHQRLWEENYRWPFMFFGAVLFWNLVGTGLFGFMNNPPIALYYMQGLNTTANHGHASLFGVYGMLGFGLILYCMGGLTDVRLWNQKLLKVSFWSLNIGLAMMTFLSLLPQGLLQTYASIEHGYSYARSAEFVHSAVMEGLVWARVSGDIVFSVGVGAFVLFVFPAFRGSTVIVSSRSPVKAAN